jgi:hypothetical protein
MGITSILSNREIAAGIWLLIVFLWALSSGGVRRSMLGLLEAFFVKGIILPILAMLLYVLLMVLVFRTIGFWDISALKDTILWTFGNALATFFNLTKVVEDKRYFRKAIIDNIRLTLLLEFVINLYSFSLIIELILVPVVSIIGLMGAVAESKPETRPLKIVINSILSIFGVGLLGFTLWGLFSDLQTVTTLKTLRDFLLPPVFTIAFLPFVYLMAIYMQYQRLFSCLDFANKDVGLAKYAKRMSFAACHLSLSKLNRFSKNVGFPKVNSRDEVLALIRKVQ